MKQRRILSVMSRLSTRLARSMEHVPLQRRTQAKLMHTHSILGLRRQRGSAHQRWGWTAKGGTTSPSYVHAPGADVEPLPLATELPLRALLPLPPSSLLSSSPSASCSAQVPRSSLPVALQNDPNPATNPAQGLVLPLWWMGAGVFALTHISHPVCRQRGGRSEGGESALLRSAPTAYKDHVRGLDECGYDNMVVVVAVMCVDGWL